MPHSLRSVHFGKDLNLIVKRYLNDVKGFNYVDGKHVKMGPQFNDKGMSILNKYGNKGLFMDWDPYKDDILYNSKGQLHGLRTRDWPPELGKKREEINGKPMTEILYEEGKGKRIKEYHEDGYLKSTGPLAYGLRQGPFKEYHSNGIISESFTFQSNYKEGRYKKYNTEGKLIESGNYKNSSRSGISNFYDEDGKISRTQDFGNLFTVSGRIGRGSENWGLWRDTVCEGGGLGFY